MVIACSVKRMHSKHIVVNSNDNGCREKDDTRIVLAACAAPQAVSIDDIEKASSPLIDVSLIKNLFGPLHQDIKTLLDASADIKESIAEFHRLILAQTSVNAGTISRTSCRSTVPLIHVHTETLDGDRPETQLSLLVKHARARKCPVFVDAINREVTINGKDISLTTLSFDILASLVSRLPYSSSSRHLHNDAWRDMARAHVTGAIPEHLTVKRGINRLNDQICARLSSKIIYVNDRWRFSPPLSGYCLVSRPKPGGERDVCGDS